MNRRAAALLLSAATLTLPAYACTKGNWYETSLPRVDAGPKWKEKVQEAVATYAPQKGHLYGAIALESDPGGKNYMNVWLWVRCDIEGIPDRSKYEVVAIPTTGDNWSSAVTKDFIQGGAVALGFNHAANDFIYIKVRD